MNSYLSFSDAWTFLLRPKQLSFSDFLPSYPAQFHASPIRFSTKNISFLIILHFMGFVF